MTDLSLIGGLIIAAVDTEGKPSLGWRGRRAARKVCEAVTAALPVGAASGGTLTDSELRREAGTGPARRCRAGPRVRPRRAERGAELAEVARERAPELAEAARERGRRIRRCRARARPGTGRGWPVRSAPQDRPRVCPRPRTPVRQGGPRTAPDSPRRHGTRQISPTAHPGPQPRAGRQPRSRRGQSHAAAGGPSVDWATMTTGPAPDHTAYPSATRRRSRPPRAGRLACRFFARLIDGIIVGVVGFLLFFVTDTLSNIWVTGLFTGLLTFVYFVAFEVTQGWTPGKKLLGLRVHGPGGHRSRPNSPQSATR